MTHKIFNASNIFGATAFFALIAATGAVEGEMYITALALLAVFAGCAYLSIRENGDVRED